VEASLGPTPIPAKEEAALRTVYADAEILSPEPMTPPPDSAAMNATSAALPVERGQVAAAPEPAVSELNTSSVTRPAAQDQTASIQPDASGAPLPDAPPPAEEPAETAAESTLVDLNTASLEELNDLGAGRIGRAIIRGRPYASAEDLVTKKVLRRSDFEKIKGLVAVEDRMEGEQALRR
jgi:DNA uptake protein ComE-like DNA-binding protein